MKVEKALGPVGCTNEIFPLGPPGRGGQPHAGILAVFTTAAGGWLRMRMLPRSTAVITAVIAAVSTCSVAGFVSVNFYDPSFDKGPPKDRAIK